MCVNCFSFIDFLPPAQIGPARQLPMRKRNSARVLWKINKWHDGEFASELKEAQPQGGWNFDVKLCFDSTSLTHHNFVARRISYGRKGLLKGKFVWSKLKRGFVYRSSRCTSIVRLNWRNCDKTVRNYLIINVTEVAQIILDCRGQEIDPR